MKSEKPTTSSALQDDYKQAGFGSALNFGTRPALLVIDVVQAYLVPGSPLYAPAFQAALESNQRLVLAARQAGVPVIFTGVEYGAHGLDGGLFYRKVGALKCFLKGSPLGQFPPSLQPASDEVVVLKQYASAFFGTSLVATLNSLRIDTLMITGFSTSGCVRATALDALQHGFIPFVVSDACGDRDPKPHESNLFDLQAKYAQVINEDQGMELLKSR